jgi:hypothetical protein
MESNQQTLKTQELTILAFINGPLRTIYLDELSKLNISHEYSTILQNRIVEKLINNTEIITDFTENKKEFIIDIKKYIKLTKKQTSKASELVNIAKKPAATTPKHDESSEEFDDAKLKKLKVTELKEIYLKKCGTVVPKDFKKQDLIDAILTQNDNAKYDEDNDEDDDKDDDKGDDEDDDEEEEV